MNVWCGVLCNKLNGPYVFDNLTGNVLQLVEDTLNNYCKGGTYYNNVGSKSFIKIQICTFRA